ncbi:MAG: hypothetical protein ACOCZ5_00615 [bacterium]
MIEYPEGIKNGADILKWFGWYFEEHSNQGRLPKSFYSGKGAGFIRRMKNEGYNIEEITVLVWGVCSTKPQTKSINYCSYFKNELGKFYQLKEDLEKKKKQQEELEDVEYVEVEEENNDSKEDDLFGEFL